MGLASHSSKGEMTNYKIDKNKIGIDISVTDAKNDKQKLSLSSIL